MTTPFTWSLRPYFSRSWSVTLPSVRPSCSTVEVTAWSGSAGFQKRACLYSNLWIYNTQNKWVQLREAKSSATSELGRKDYDHYVEGNGVVLSTGGYGPAKGSRGVTLKIPESSTPPTVNLATLPTN